MSSRHKYKLLCICNIIVHNGSINRLSGLIGRETDKVTNPRLSGQALASEVSAVPAGYLQIKATN
jgi:hypothetical protein